MKKILIAIGAILILLSGISLFSRNISTNPTINQGGPPRGAAVNVTQTIQLPSGNKTAKDILMEGKTALDLLKSATQVEMRGAGANAYVVSIDGIAADDNQKEFWAFYVNGQQASVGAGSYKLREGDQILWKIEKY